MNINKLEIFPTPIVVVDDFITDQVRLDLLEKIKNLEHHSHGIFTGNGYGTYEYKHNNSFLDPHTFYEIEKLSNEYAKIRKIMNVKIHSYWSVIQRKGAILKIHSHPECVISGVLYINVDEDSSNLYFENPNPFIHFQSSEKNNKYSIDRYCIEPKNNRLVLFPSWLMHGSDSTPNNTDFRVCISFNLTYDYEQ